MAEYLVTLQRYQHIDVYVTADSRDEAICEAFDGVEGGQITYETDWEYSGTCEQLD